MGVVIIHDCLYVCIPTVLCNVFEPFENSSKIAIKTNYSILTIVNRLNKLLSEVAALRSSNSLLQDDCRQKAEQLDKTNIELTALKTERAKMVQVKL